MAADRSRTTTIDPALRDVGEVFVAPDRDPMGGQFRSVSGLDQLAADLPLPAAGQPEPDEIRPLLLADRIEDGLTKRVGAALRAYCAVRIREFDRQQALVRKQGWRELRFGLVFLAICLLAAAAVLAVEAFPPFLRTFLSEGLVIVGWIALWHPVDMLLFANWPLIRDRQVLERLRAMEVEIRPIGATTGEVARVAEPVAG